MLLARLFGELLRCGVCVVFTGNRPPRELYKGGLSRRFFEPFIALIDDRCVCV
jgi:predicted ATPase